jgi:hypothetical protein
MSTDQLKVLSTIAGEITNKFNGDRDVWSDRKIYIQCKLADSSLQKYINIPYEKLDEKEKLEASKCWSCIIKHLSGNALILVQNIPIGDAYTVWSTLTEKYEAPNPDLAYTIQIEIEQIKLNENESIDTYKAKLDSKFNKISNMIITNKLNPSKFEKPYEVSEKQKIFTFLRGIPNDYLNFGSLKVICSQNPQLTYDQCAQSFSNWYIKMAAERKANDAQNISTDSFGTSMINFSNTENKHSNSDVHLNKNYHCKGGTCNNNYKPNSSGQRYENNNGNVQNQHSNHYNTNSSNTSNRNNKLCHSCGSPQHFRSMCPDRNSICEICGKPGHISKICHLNKKKNINVQNTNENKNGPNNKYNFFTYSHPTINEQVANQLHHM